MEYTAGGDALVIRLSKGEEVVASIKEVAAKENIRSAVITGIGAVDFAKVGVFLARQKTYVAEELSGDMEITSLSGSVTRMDGAPYIHIHATLAGEKGVFGGHLNEAYVSATLEVILISVNIPIDRKYDTETGLNLMKF